MALNGINNQIGLNIAQMFGVNNRNQNMNQIQNKFQNQAQNQNQVQNQNRNQYRYQYQYKYNMQNNAQATQTMTANIQSLSLETQVTALGVQASLLSKING